MDSRLNGLPALFGITAFVAVMLLNIRGLPEYALRADPAAATNFGYEPSREDYYVSAYRHGVPFIFMRRHGGCGEADAGSLPVDLKDLDVSDFSERSSAWPIDNAPLKNWSPIALGGNVAIAVALAAGLFVLLKFVLSVLSAKQNAPESPRLARPQLIGVCGLLLAMVALLCFVLFTVRLPDPAAVTANVQSEPLEISTPTLSEPQPVSEDVRNDNSLSMELRWCEPGEIACGERKIEIVDGFWIGRNEVTQAEYRQVMGKNPALFQANPQSPYPWEGDSLSPSLLAFKEKQRREMVSGLDSDHLPIESISWDDATAFCRRLTEIERKAGRISDAWAYQLPAEKQWEYACRAGSPIEETLDSTQANFDGRYPLGKSSEGPFLGRPAEVRNYSPNAWGLFDFHGNVQEFCLDSFRREPILELNGTDTTEMVVRGGSFALEGADCSSDARSRMVKNSMRFDTGFRVVLTTAHADSLSD